MAWPTISTAWPANSCLSTYNPAGRTCRARTVRCRLTLQFGERIGDHPQPPGGLLAFRTPGTVRTGCSSSTCGSCSQSCFAKRSAILPYCRTCSRPANRTSMARRAFERADSSQHLDMLDPRQFVVLGTTIQKVGLLLLEALHNSALGDPAADSLCRRGKEALS